MLANALQYNRPKDEVYKLALQVGRALESKVDQDERLQVSFTLLLGLFWHLCGGQGGPGRALVV